MTKIAGKNVLLTGAAHGLGRQLALALAKQGAHLILWDRETEALEQLAQEIRNFGARADTQVVDLAKSNDIHQALHEHQQRNIHVDILINNAGIVDGKSLVEQSEESIRKIFEVNVLAPILLTRAVIAQMGETKSGHIVFISSASALCGTSRLTTYTASKAALAGFEEALYFEGKHLHYPVHTTVVFPYYFSSGMFAGVRSRFSQLLPILPTEEVAKKIINAIQNNQNRAFIPRFVFVSIIAKLLPRKLFATIAEFFGINASMDHFTGHSHKHTAHINH